MTDHANIDRPILFSAPMVRALLAGEKTQTRRLAWRERIVFGRNRGHGPQPPVIKEVHTIWQKVHPGGRLWVRETWGAEACYDENPSRDIHPEANVLFLADNVVTNTDPMTHFGKTRPAIFMPRWASRLTLIVTAAKVQRLQEIIEKDAKAEGLLSATGDGGGLGAGYKWTGVGYHGAGFTRNGARTFHTPNEKTGRCRCNVGGPTPAQCAFRELWDALHKPGNRWADNPEIVALTYRVIQSNIDEIGEAA